MFANVLSQKLKIWICRTLDQWVKYQELIILWLFKHETVLVIHSFWCMYTYKQWRRKMTTDTRELQSDLPSITHRILANRGGAVSHHRIQSCVLFITALTSEECFPPLLINGCTVHFETKWKTYKEKYSQIVYCSVVTFFIISKRIKNRWNVKNSFVTFISLPFCLLAFWRFLCRSILDGWEQGFQHFVETPSDTLHQSTL